jgi:type IV pilus assembly protein PilY1
MHFIHGDYNVGDIRSGQTGKQWIIGHTVGLALDDPNGQTYLNELSAAGGGKSYAANNPAQLATALSEIVSNAINRSAALARPTITLNVFNPNYDRDDVYMTFFDPKGKSRWAGNVKKYKFCSTRDNPATTAVEGCTLEDGSTVSFGTLLGQGSSSTSYIKATGSNGELLLSAKDLWNTSGTPDGSNVRAGGAGAVLDAMTKSTRKLYTFAGSYESSSPYTRPVNSGASNPNLTVNDNLLSQGRASSSTTCSSSTSSVNCNLTPSLFGIAGTATSDYTTMNNILKWIRDPGLDVNDGNGNGSTTDYYDPTDDDDDNATNDALWPFEDPMHAGAVPFEYGGTSTAPITKLFVPTNGGGLRMLNSATGAEEWTWVPKELLSMQSTLMSSATVLPGGTRTYGLDMTPVLWVRDDNDNDATNGIYANAQIEPSNGDFVRLFIGQRDGGRSYYGLNVSPSADVSTSSSSVTVAPQLLWKIQGGVTTGFNTLKNTWSTPVLGKIRTASGSKIVLIFGGGNDTTLNAKYGTNQGTENDANIVYIVDATTGEKLYSFGGNGTDATLKVSGMNYPVPSEITAFDSNGDGYTDRLYFGDMGGNVWRADLYYDSSTNLLASVGKFADLSLTIPGQVAGTPAGKPASSVTTPQALNVNSRSFYYRPSVTSVSRADLGGRFDMVFLVSGQRNNPRNGQDGTATGNATVVNHLYAIQDLYIGAGKKAGDSAFPARKSGASGTGPLTFTDLIDMTANNYQMTRNATTGNLELSSTQRANLKTAYSTAAGWYLPLADVGEKGVSNTTVANDILVFNTYTPADLSASTNQCAVPNPGKGRIYAVDAFTGSAIFANFDSSGTNGSTNLTTSDRALIGTGMPVDGETTAMTTSGILGLNKFGDGTASNDNTGDSGTGLRSNPFGDGLPRGRIYWYER